MSEAIRYKYKVVQRRIRVMPNGTTKIYAEGEILHNLFYDTKSQGSPSPGQTIWACDDKSLFWIKVKYIGAEKGEIQVVSKVKQKKYSQAQLTKFYHYAKELEKLDVPNLAEVLAIIGMSKIKKVIEKWFPKDE